MAQQRTCCIKRGVTLYSYQEEYYTRTMTFEDCLAEVASMGAEGVELLAEQMVPDYPNPPESWVERWYSLIRQYHLKPVCMDTFVDNDWGGHRDMSIDEVVETLATQMKLCRRLGFNMMRPTSRLFNETNAELIERTIPLAEEHDVKIAVEIHSDPYDPLRLRSKFIDNFLEHITKTGTKHFGFTLDLGILCKRLPRILSEYHLRQGASETIVNYVNAAFCDLKDPRAIVEDVRKMSTDGRDIAFAMFAGRYGPPINDLKDLPPVIEYIYNIHGKMYEMTEEMREYSIPYETIIPVLIEHGYTGYIHTEYEGQRLTQDIIETDSCEQIRRHHLMMRQLLGEI